MILRSMAALLLAAAIVWPSPVTAEGLMHFAVTQVRQLDVGAPVVRAYLDLTDSAGQPVETLAPSGLTATLGEWKAEPINVVPFTTANQGIAYVFLIDISKSLDQELFGQMVDGIETWVADMNALDQAAIIAFGESSHLIVDFTSSKNELLAGLSSLGPTDDETLLHQALADALDLNRRLDADLPGRRAVVIFSDGKDEGSAFEAEDILAKLRDDGSPIYAIGYSRLRDLAERQSYLDLLQRFASNSSGAFFAAEQTRFTEAYDSIRQTIRQVWITDFLCSDCRADGGLHRLQVQVTVDEHVLSSGGSVRLLPLIKSRESIPPDLVASEREVVEPPVVEPEPAPGEPLERTARKGLLPFELGPWLIGLSVLAVVLLLWIAFSLYRLRKRRDQSVGGYAAPPAAPLDPRSEPDVLDPPVPMPRPGERPLRSTSSRAVHQGPRSTAPPKTVRLIVVRGSRKGRQYTFVVRDRAVVGKRSDCDCVLGEEDGIDAAQFELLLQRGELFILNLSNRMPTLLSGRPVEDKARLTSDSLIGTGETVLRIVFQ